MSILRQLALAVILVAGTALAVTAYLDTQRGALHGDQEVGAPILEFGSSYPMSRPLRASTRPVARDSRLPATGVTSTRTRREVPAGGVTSLEGVQPIPASFTSEEEDELLPPSAATAPLTH